MMSDPAASGAGMHCLILYSPNMVPQTKSTCVLVIDDDPVSRELLSVLLMAEGYEVECADSGEDAIAQIHHSVSAPDLVLADAQMPGLTAAPLAGELRRICPPHTLLLAMSGSQPPQQAIAEYDGFLLKPFTMDQIAAALKAQSPPSGASNSPARREKWTVVRGPAGHSPPNSRLISIAASAPLAASSRRARSRPQPPPSTETAPPALDEVVYRQLAASMPASQLREMYALCLRDVRTRIAVMREFMDAQDGVAFVREAHSIKGGCGMLGATELHRMAAHLEANGLEAALTGGSQTVNSLDDLLCACDRLERILGSRP